MTFGLARFSGGAIRLFGGWPVRTALGPAGRRSTSDSWRVHRARAGRVDRLEGGRRACCGRGRGVFAASSRAAAPVRGVVPRPRRSTVSGTCRPARCAEVRVAVVGATGTIGAPLVQALSRSHEVVAVARTPAPEQATGVEWVGADATDADALRGALDGADVVYHLVHSLGSGDFEALDRAAAAAVAAAAAATGAGQIVYLGGLGDESADLSPHLRSRVETAKILADGPVPVTTLRAAMIVGAGSAAFETILALVDRLPVMICPRWVSVETQPVALADVVSALVGVCGNAAAYGQTFDLGGAGGDDVSRDDGAGGPPPWQASDLDRGSVLDSAALVPVALPRDSSERLRCPAPRRRPSGPDGSPGRPDLGPCRRATNDLRSGNQRSAPGGSDRVTRLITCQPKKKSSKR